jgi:hypothetical protein
MLKNNVTIVVFDNYIKLYLSPKKLHTNKSEFYLYKLINRYHFNHKLSKIKYIFCQFFFLNLQSIIIISYG